MYSVKILGTHQRLDRAARKHLAGLNDAHKSFPAIRDILKFEAANGPDGIKRKSPGHDEPWHYYDPFDEDDSGLLDIIEEHFNSLVEELKAKNIARVSFEASWLAHALVDGLTPAHHHHHYEKGIEDIYGPDNKSTRDSRLKKVVVPAASNHGFIKGNWKLWGPKGLLTSHMLFEGGAALIIQPMAHSFGKPSGYDTKLAESIGVIEYFKRTAREVALLNMYDRFCDTGWTNKLAREVRDELAPRMVKMITLAWHLALESAAQPELATVTE
jgi:hypothetical protein